MLLACNGCNGGSKLKIRHDEKYIFNLNIFKFKSCVLKYRCSTCALGDAALL